MRIKKFNARSLKEATEQMRQELGPDAIVLGTRTIAKGGGLGLFGRDTYEVTGAIDEPATGRGSSYAAKRAATPYERYLDPSASVIDTTAHLEELRKVAERFDTRRHPSPTSRRSSGESLAEVGNIVDLRNEMQAMQGALREISDHLKYAKIPELPDTLRELYTTLIDQEVDDALARQMILTVNEALTPDQRQSRELTREALLRVMARLIKVPETGKSKRRKIKVVALVGPTGVGKTTTIAKLAAIHKLLHRKNVGLISTDTYRIGAIEQLRTFASIADIPMDVAYKPAEVASALRKFKDRDIVFIDTVGRSHRSKKEVSELAKYVQSADPDEVHLVLSASTSPRAIAEIIRQFGTVKPNRLLFTKLDEAVSLGPIFSIVNKQHIPVAYVTTGQTVPDDIVAVDPAQFASMVYSGAPAHA
ncbi:MAG: flagellar biosynthesis protein FlhF [Bacteroidota bacterium]